MLCLGVQMRDNIFIRHVKVMSQVHKHYQPNNSFTRINDAVTCTPLSRFGNVVRIPPPCSLLFPTFIFFLASPSSSEGPFRFFLTHELTIWALLSVSFPSARGPRRARSNVTKIMILLQIYPPNLKPRKETLQDYYVLLLHTFPL